MNAYLRAAQVVRSSGAKSCVVSIERHDHGDATPPHEVALERLLGSLQEYARLMSEHVLVLADEVHSAERHRTNFRFFQESGPKENDRLDRILDTLYFGPSQHSRLLQAADLLSFIYLRRLTVKEADPRAQTINDAIWAQFKATLVASYNCLEQHEGPDQMTGA